MPAEAPSWASILSAAARLQSILPDAVLVGGTACALHARYRVSDDTDHVCADLATRFHDVRATLESDAGWHTHRVQRPVLILGRLLGVRTGVRQLIRPQPLETIVLRERGVPIRVPTAAEMLRIKGALIVQRNHARDYLDVAALTEHMGVEAARAALSSLDALYAQVSNGSPLQQLRVRLATPEPDDIDAAGALADRTLAPQWQDWSAVATASTRLAAIISDPVSVRAASRGSRRSQQEK